MTKAVFLDRDGVINNDTGHYYIFQTSDFILNKDISASLKLLTDAGFILIVISNQGGIAKGLYTRQDAQEVNNYMSSLLKEDGISITEVYFCPHHPEHGKCLCRKPSSLMIEKAIARFEVDIHRSFMIGDSSRDIEAAEKAGIKAFKVGTNESIMNICTEIIKNSH